VEGRHDGLDLLVRHFCKRLTSSALAIPFLAFSLLGQDSAVGTFRRSLKLTEALVGFKNRATGKINVDSTIAVSNCVMEIKQDDDHQVSIPMSNLRLDDTRVVRGSSDGRDNGLEATVFIDDDTKSLMNVRYINVDDEKKQEKSLNAFFLMITDGAGEQVFWDGMKAFEDVARTCGSTGMIKKVILK
jgi:hypothetical protein